MKVAITIKHGLSEAVVLFALRLLGKKSRGM